MKVLSESRDPAIKLFGKTIPLIPSSAIGEAAAATDAHKGSPHKAIAESESETLNKEQESPNSEQGRNEQVNADDDTEKASPEDQESDATEKEQKTAEEQQQNDSGNPQEKPVLKKPDKILPCPRCSSMDTKFCYYNNYNVNQPRHFCKNCQRYWTAGGTMRNVPVGAGRRKNKNSAANHYHHLTMADAALQAIPDTIHHPTLKHNGTVLSFGSDTPLCESMASVLNIAEKTMKNCTRNGFQRFEEQRDEQSTGSSAPASNSSTDGGAKVNSQEPALRSCQSFPPHLPYINGSQWLYPPPPAAAPPPFGPGSFPVPIYSGPAYWACNAWSMPWLAPMASPSTATVSSGSGPNSPTLGKHSRDGNVLQRNNSSRSTSDKEESAKQSINQEKCLWFPKTLRIDDPEEAARSSIWATIGFKNDKSDGVISHGGLFKAFQTKEDHQLPNHKVVASQALYANPAALSRSISFQEST